jgi:hypothetical protein
MGRIPLVINYFNPLLNSVGGSILHWCGAGAARNHNGAGAATSCGTGSASDPICSTDLKIKIVKHIFFIKFIFKSNINLRTAEDSK